MSLETELVQFVKQLPAFWAPIASRFSLSTSGTPTDNRILDRMTYGGSFEDRSIPRLVWTGPFDYDQGTVALGAIVQKTAKFWFTVYADYLDTCTDWMQAIENAVLAAFSTQGQFHALTTVRIMSMIYVKGSKFQPKADQVLMTGQELPSNAFTICYQICWQPLA